MAGLIPYNNKNMTTFGIEEEVFIVEPTRPSTQSLYYLSKLVWKKPKKYLFHTDSNFARNRDILQGLMSAVEISTYPHGDIDDLIEDLYGRRLELKEVSEGLIIPIGHLFDYSAPTNTAALQFHVGNMEDPKRTYDNLVYFLPLLILLAANSPIENMQYHSKSYRLLNSFAVGPIKKDWEYRFQDIIFAKRTKTIELRAFDPIWDIERIRTLANIIKAIADYNGHFKLDIKRYNHLRKEACLRGYTQDFEEIYQSLNKIVHVPKALFEISPSDIIYSYYKKNGMQETYCALDSGYIDGKLFVKEIPMVKNNLFKKMAGFAGYYIPKLPYDIWKLMKEH
jgi:hypothetical protein